MMRTVLFLLAAAAISLGDKLPGTISYSFRTPFSYQTVHRYPSLSERRSAPSHSYGHQLKRSSLQPVQFPPSSISNFGRLLNQQFHQSDRHPSASSSNRQVHRQTLRKTPSPQPHIFRNNGYFPPQHNTQRLTHPPEQYIPPQPTSPPNDYIPPQPTSPPKDYLLPQPTSPPNDYIPPQPTSPPKDYLPPHQLTNPPDEYLPPQEPVSPPNEYLPPQEPVIPSDEYLPPQEPVNPPNEYLPPQEPVIPSDEYLPPQEPVSPPNEYLPPQEPVIPSDEYLPPQEPVNPPNEYLPPQEPVIPSDEYLPPQEPVNPPNEYLPPQEPVIPSDEYLPPQEPVNPPNEYLPPQESLSPPNEYLSPYPEPSAPPSNYLPPVDAADELLPVFSDSYLPPSGQRFISGGRHTVIGSGSPSLSGAARQSFHISQSLDDSGVGDPCTWHSCGFGQRCQLISIPCQPPSSCRADHTPRLHTQCVPEHHPRCHQCSGHQVCVLETLCAHTAGRICPSAMQCRALRRYQPTQGSRAGSSLVIGSA